MKPMYALHKDSTGAILAAASFGYDYELAQFIRNADIRPGDSIHFGEAVKREDEPEPLPAFLADEPEAPTPPPAPAMAGEDQPF